MKSRDALGRALLVTGLIWVGVAHATLGGDAASVNADAAVLHGMVLADGPAGVLEINVDNGVRVRELLDATGVVFAVSWTGPAPPDLGQLLGRYNQRFATTLASLPTPGRQRAVHVASADLVVDVAGHLRAYSGRAYLPSRVPPGMAITAVR